MQLNFDRIRDAADRLGWPPLTALRASSPASLREARPATITPAALFPFAHCDGSVPPANLLAGIRSVLGTTRDATRDDFEVGGNGFGAARRHSELMDALVCHLLELAGQRVPPAARKADGLPLAVAAIGGYGRGELAPSSDVDLLFLTASRRATDTAEIVEFVLYRLWDLGLRVGHAVRSVGECVSLARSDWRAGISLLDLRFLWGRRALYDELAGRFSNEIAKSGEALVDALLCDLADRHARYHDPAAPDVKRGRGGLRDLQTLLWLGKIRSQAHQANHVVGLRFLGPANYSSCTDAVRFLWSVRCHLHYLTGRAEERLSTHLQPEIARRVLWHELPERRSAAVFMDQFWRATRQIEDLSARFVRH